MTLPEVLPFLAGIAVLVVLTVTILRIAEVGLGWLPVVAIVRAVVQLALVALLLSGALTAWWAVAAFIGLMLTTASLTSLRRAREVPRGPLGAVVGVVVGTLVTLGLVLALGLVDLQFERVIAIAGIVSGNAMTAATLAMRRYDGELRGGWGEVEAWLAVGAHPRRATKRLRQIAVREALLPNLDQTKNTGLVTLPGAFVGALFGGASPLEAAQFQIVVLASLMLAGALTAVLATQIASGTALRPVDPAG
ncbi:MULTISPECIES: ABC transporter permease [Brevibacterium]|uniref:ABC transporter permease n=1 Tax=Brevibacterium casei TaxID=33889 RepID=A0A7T4A0E0_9MICO|nr:MULTISPECIES: ABC transporter permease [Brevibacterium]QQB15015.1 ABC transporter permease [Brevibacterium casei]